MICTDLIVKQEQNKAIYKKFGTADEFNFSLNPEKINFY